MLSSIEAGRLSCIWNFIFR